MDGARVQNLMHFKHKCDFSRVVRKPAFCICESKDVDQQFLVYLNTKFQASSHLLSLYSLIVVWDLVGNTEDRFSRNEAHLSVMHEYI